MSPYTKTYMAAICSNPSQTYSDSTAAWAKLVVMSTTPGGDIFMVSNEGPNDRTISPVT